MKRKRSAPIFVLFLCLAVVLSTMTARAAESITLSGTLTNADYLIRVPANWNGTLLVYAHGYSAEVPDASAAPGGALMEEALLQMGYALAGSSYRNGGWAVKEGIQNTLALTNYFRGHVGNPQRIILWSNSMGAGVTLKSIEKYPGIYDGAVAACGLTAGSTKSADWLLAFTLAYDVVFGIPGDWGTVDDIRNDLTFQEMVAHLGPQLLNPANGPLFEFVRMVSDIPFENFYPGVPPNTNPNSAWIILDMFFATQARGEIEERAGGPIGQNLDHIYTLDPSELSILNTLGVDAQELLNAMNARTTIEAHRPARHYIERYADYTGDLKRPVLTMHTKRDGLLLAAQEGVYHESVAAAGKEQFLVQAFTEGVTHCDFTGPQYIAAISAMDQWIATGERPDEALSELGFDLTYVPPAWPHVTNASAAAAGQRNAEVTQIFLPLIAK